MKRIYIFAVLVQCILSIYYFPSAVSAQKILIDTRKVINTNANQVGCWLNTHESSNNPEFEDLMRRTKIKSLRMGWQYSVMDSLNPEVFVSSPCEPGVQSYVTGGDCFLDEKITINETAKLLDNLGIPGFIVVATDGVNYTGTADVKLSKMSVEQREQFYIKNAVRLANWAKNSKLKYFEIGNENDLPGEMVNNGVGKPWTGSKYGAFALKIAKAIKQANPDIKCGINGGWGATETLRKQWWTDIVAAAPEINDYIDFIVVHNYAFGLSYSSWNGSIWVWGNIRDDIGKSVASLFPNKPIYVTEIGGFKVENNKIPHYRALVNIEMLSTVFLNPLVKHAQHWPDRWSNTGAIEKGANNLTALGNGMAAYTQFAKPILVANGASGKITYNVTRDSVTNGLSIWLTNHNAFGSVVDVTLQGYIPSGKNEIWTLTSPGDDPNSKTNELKLIGDLPLKTDGSNTSLTISLNATSATILSFDAENSHQPKIFESVTNTAGNEIFLSFNQKILSITDSAAFSVFADGNALKIDSLCVSDKKTAIAIKQSGNFTSENKITIQYKKGSVQFESGNDLSVESDLSVVNNTKSNSKSPVLIEAKTNDRGNIIYLVFNEPMKTPASKDAFSVLRDGEITNVNSLLQGTSPNILAISLMSTPDSEDQLIVSYQGTSVLAESGMPLEKFNHIPVVNMAQKEEPKQTVYGNTRNPWIISDGALIQAENYDQGGKGIAYHDNTPKESDCAMGIRPGDDVDIYSANDEGVNGYSVGHTEMGEWVEFTVEIQEGKYTLDARCSVKNDSASMLVFVDSVLIATVHARHTGLLNEYKTFTSGNFNLTGKKKATLRIVFQNDIKLNYVQFNKYIGTSAAQVQAQNENWLFPNPADNYIRLNLTGSYDMTITDVLGRTLIKAKLADNQTVDVSSLPMGIYSVRIDSNGIEKVSKFIKQ